MEKISAKILAKRAQGNYNYLRDGEVAFVDVEIDQVENDPLIGKVQKLFKTKAIHSLNELHDLLERDQKIKTIIIHGHIEAKETEEFVSLVRKDDLLKEIPIVFITEQITKKIKKKLLEKGVDEVFDENFSDEELTNRTAYLMGHPHTDEIHNLHSHQYVIPLSKRVFDIVFSGTALLFLSPLFIVLSILIKLESKGPIFYVSKRAGSGFKIFGFIKFRSMAADADTKLKDMAHLNNYSKDDDPKPVEQEKIKKVSKSEGTKLYGDSGEIAEEEYLENMDKEEEAPTFFKIKNDSRVTKIGQFIRKTSIDELPQLINVFKGDMSIVGNRPLPLYEAEKITSDEFVQRFMAPAGITGWWQTAKRGKENMSTNERIKLDIAYAKKYSFLLDLKIIARTFPSMLQKDNV